MELKEIESSLLRAFPMLSIEVGNYGSWPPPMGADEFAALASRLAETGLLGGVPGLVWSGIELHLRRSTAPSFWAFWPEGEVAPEEGFSRFVDAVRLLRDGVGAFAPAVGRLVDLGVEDAPRRFETLCRGALVARLPPRFSTLVAHFYAVSLRAFRFERADDEAEQLRCAGCSGEREDPSAECARCERVLAAFDETNRRLRELGLLERLAGGALAGLVRERIEGHVRETCKGSFDAPHLAPLERWLETGVLGWLARIRGGEGEIRAREEFADLLRDAFARTRIDQLFNIVIEYPDSRPAVDDLRECLRSGPPGLRAALADGLRRALETRLLHPGVNTPDVLTAYVSAIKALRRLDPSGVLSVKVTRPVRNYLRTRDDTVRSVVSGLTEDGPGGELAEELARGEDPRRAGAAEDEAPWESWRPEPVDADPHASSKYRRSGDILSMLVNVYGSKELFVNEYRTLLADRLLAQGVRNAEKERRYLELLKRRFGESQLHYCEVMLKDISDSKRINGLIRQDPSFEAAAGGFPSNALILSAQFWPPFKEDSLEPPPAIRRRLDAYTKTFETLKGNRTLNWKPHLGVVDLEIEVGGKTLELSVSPMQATIILHFERRAEWHVDDLSQTMRVTATVLRRKMTYWQSMGIISSSGPDVYVLNENDPGGASAPKKTQEMVCEEEEESPMASASDQREGELQVFWSYIVGMLTNLDSMPLERIHQMLKMFASQTPDTECSLQELRHFLEIKVRNHQLILQGGLYKLPKV